MRKIGAFCALISGGAIGALHALPVEDVKAAGKCRFCISRCGSS